MVPTLECRECPVLGALEPDACPFRIIKKKAGDLVFGQGLVLDAAWHLKSGLVLLSSVSPRGDEEYCTLRTPGSMLNVESLRDRPTVHEGWALTDVEVCQLGTAAVSELVGRRPSMATLLQDKALDELSQCVTDRTHRREPATVRLARLIASFQDEAISPLLERLPRSVIARLLGMRPETLSRSLAELRAAGALVGGRALEVADGDRLQEIVDGGR